MSTRTIAYSGMIAAVYFVLTIALAPISYGPLQLRVSGLLVPLALANPVYGLGLAVGVALANLTSPFGAWDFVAMPIAMYAITQGAYRLRGVPWLALPLTAIWQRAPSLSSRCTWAAGYRSGLSSRGCSRH